MTSAPPGRPWLQPLRTASRTAAAEGRRDRLVCWPHAGGSAAAFQPFAAALPGFAVSAVQLPGRGARLREPAVTDPERAVDGVLAELAGLPDTGGRLVLFGHSLGAAMAHLLAVRAGAAPDLLVLSAWPALAPGAARAADTRAGGRGTEDLVAFMRWLGSPGLDELDESDVVAHLVPPLAADLMLGDALASTWDGTYATVPVLLVFCEDDPAVTERDVLAWRHVVDVRGQVRIPGGHFAVFEQVAAVAEGITRALPQR